MKHKLLVLLLACTMGAAALTTGCGSLLDKVDKVKDGVSNLNPLDLSEGAAETTPDAKETIDDTIQLASRWYDKDGEILANAVITASMDGTEIYSGTTDENGVLEGFSFPSGKEILFAAADANGTALGSAAQYYEISEEYNAITVRIPSAEANRQKILLPAKKNTLIAAMGINAAGKVRSINVILNRGGSDPATTAAKDTGEDDAADAAADNSEQAPEDAPDAAQQPADDAQTAAADADNAPDAEDAADDGAADNETE